MKLAEMIAAAAAGVAGATAVKFLSKDKKESAPVAPGSTTAATTADTTVPATTNTGSNEVKSE
ncbi:MAG: hypothetical protein J6Y15_10585 [Bacteroidaceae bacterium]|nr:hypothetical protein [Bacteroidaceae bacterium]